MAKASDFKFGTQLGLLRPIIKSHPKSGGDLELRELPKILGFPEIFLQRIGLTTSNLARRHHKITRRRKGGRGPGL